MSTELPTTKGRPRSYSSNKDCRVNGSVTDSCYRSAGHNYLKAYLKDSFNHILSDLMSVLMKEGLHIQHILALSIEYAIKIDSHTSLRNKRWKS